MGLEYIGQPQVFTSLTADDIFATNLTSLSSTLNVVNITEYELSGFDITGDVDIHGNLSAENGYFDGNVGIGTTTPSEELDVVGDIKASGRLYCGTSPQIRITGAANGGDVALDGSTLFAMRATGNESPTNPLRYLTLLGAPLKWTSQYGSRQGDTGLYRDAAGTLAQRNGTAAQTSHIYKSWADAGANYERAALKWDSDTFTIATEASGTGQARDIVLAPARDIVLTPASGSVGIGTATPAAKLDIADTWNDAATTFSSIKLNVTDTASTAGSKLMDLQVGGASKLTFRKDGLIYGQGTVAHTLMLAVDTYLYNGSTGRAACLWSDQNRMVGGPLVLSDNINVNTQNISQCVALYKDAANTLAQRNGTAAQTFRIYNTFTSVSNFERANLKWESDAFTVSTEKGSSGQARDIVLAPASGRVGIGTATPASSLDVVGDIKLSGSVHMTTDGSPIIMQSADGTEYELRVSNAGALVITTI